MRANILHPGADELQEEICGIVKLAQKFAKTGITITWENIGDPIAKGEEVPQWIRDIVAREVNHNETYAYSPTKGLLTARKFLSVTRHQETGAELSPENIIFFNGLGDAITKIYTWLNPTARVLGPNPAYSSHSSIEGVHALSPQLTYNLDSKNNWLPEIDDVHNKVRDNPSVVALLIVNPNNPTGMVYPRETLEEFVAIAKEYDLFLIADETYAQLAFDAEHFISIAEVTKGVPAIIMRGLSKAIPWPGSRCGWLEFYHEDADADFRRYVQSIEEAKMAEVCSTTLPQAVLPAILGDERYPAHLEARRRNYARRAHQAAETLNFHPAFNVVASKGAFYLPVTFSNEFLQQKLNIPAANPEAQKLLDGELANVPMNDFDKRFCYQLMAATGVCTVPLTAGFNSHVPGFRMTLLETDDAKFAKTLEAITKFCRLSPASHPAIY